ncbi:MAG: TIR domain-containing protein [Lachnospiraceae bacterium]|nr:TIR domain-containing protein [Lachnospiraceae bacterium]
MANKNSVFISYCSKDIKFVNQIIEELEKMGVPYWKAPEMIPAGSSYAREIPQAIQNCMVFLLVLSPTSQSSIWVEKETDSAICNRKIIIPFQILEMEMNDTFRFYLNNVQMISYFENPKKAFSDLRRQFRQLMPEIFEEQDSKTDRIVREISSKDNEGRQIDSIQREKDAREKVLSIEPVPLGAKKRRNTNAFRMNRIPLACQHCGCKVLKNITVGVYRCERCGRDNYDDFQTIRNYLERAGAASALVIERDTGVPRRIIEYFFRDEYLEIPKNSPVRVPCECCGAPIRTGILCDNCKADPKKQPTGERKGSWHSLW